MMRDHSIDALTRHCRATRLVDWVKISAQYEASLGSSVRSNNVSELHRRHVFQFDVARSELRGARMMAAIQEVDCMASAGRELSWELLTCIQQRVMGLDGIDFRNGPAYAKGGGEVYAYHPQLHSAFAAKITKDDRDELQPLIKAVRLYLDICFFHPFCDGNARAARLGFQFILQRDGVSMREIGPLFRLPLAAGGVEGYRSFAKLAVLLALR